MQKVKAFMASWKCDHFQINWAFEDITCKDIRCITGLSASGEHLLYRIKLQALPWWHAQRPMRVVH